MPRQQEGRPVADLTRQQELFCQYLIADELQNQTEAYKKAYPKSSQKAAETSSCMLLKNPKISAYIDKLKDERSKRTRVDADWLLRRLADEAGADIADIYNSDTGALKPIHEWPKIWRMGLVTGVDVQRIGSDDQALCEVVKVRMADRVRRLELIGRHISVRAFEESQQTKQSGRLEVVITRATKPNA